MGKLPFEVKRELLVKSNEEPGDFGTLPHKRSIEELLQKGIINVNKPAGPTSHQICEWVQDILKVEKVGHSGTLDPNVTGVLVTGIGDGTKILQSLLGAGKEYVCLMHLHEDAEEKEIEKIFKEFTGKIYQTPPLKSAVKRVLRVRKIYYLELLEKEGKDVLFKVGCEAGTYIRKLCVDIGMVLGIGAHMQQLRRTRVGKIDEENIVTLHDLKDAYHYWKEDGEEKYLRKAVQPMEAGFAHLPRIVVSDHAVDSLCFGAQLAVPGVLKVDSGIKKGSLVAVLTQKGEGVLLARTLMKSEEILKEKHGFAVKTERVLMEKGVYPKYNFCLPSQA